MEIDELKQAIGKGDIPAWATEDTLQRLVQALGKKGTVGDFAKSMGRTGDTNPRTFIGGLTQAARSTGQLTRSATLVGKSFNAFNKVLQGSAGVVATLAASRGRFSDLNPVISTVTKGFGDLGSTIPIVGGFFKAVAGVTEEVAKLNNAIVDDLLDSFYTVAGAGFNLNRGFQQLQIDATAAGISIQTLTSATMENIKGILAFGGDIENGSRRFVDTLAFLTNDEMAPVFKSFGMGVTETAEFLGEFIEQNRNSLRLQQMSEEQVAQTAFEYAKNLRVIAELTGTQVDEIKAQQMAQVADGAFQSKLQEMRNQGLIEEARIMEETAAGLMAVDPSGALTQAFKEQQTFGTAVTQQSALLIQQLPKLVQAFNDQDIQGARDALVGLTQDTNALRIGQFGLLDQGNPLSDLITTLLPTAQYLASIAEQGVSIDDLIQQQNDQVNALQDGNTALDTFEESLITVASDIEKLPAQIQSFVIDNIQEVTRLQISGIQKTINALEAVGTGDVNFIDLLSKAGVGTGDFLLQMVGFGPGKYSEFMESAFGDQKYGGGPTGGGMYMVGERGPELLRLNQGSMGHVYNHGQTKSMLQNRFGGGPVGGAQLSTIQMGDMGSRQVDAQGMTQALHMGLDADTTLSYFRKNGTLEIVRALMTGGGSVGVSGSAQSGQFDKTFYQAPDGSRIYGAEGQAAAMKAIQQSEQTAYGNSQGMEELINIQKDLAKYTKKTLAKIASGDGYF